MPIWESSGNANFLTTSRLKIYLAIGGRILERRNSSSQSVPAAKSKIRSVEHLGRQVVEGNDRLQYQNIECRPCGPCSRPTKKLVSRSFGRRVWPIWREPKEKYPDAKPRIISDNGPQFIARDFKE